jgi:nicotinamide-nucleotide adenylyltransferase
VLSDGAAGFEGGTVETTGGTGIRHIEALLAGLDPAGPPRLAFLRKAPAGIESGAGTLLCLSASFNPLTAAHERLVAEAGRIVPPDEILLLLAVSNVDKGVAGFPLADRLRLLAHYAARRPALSVAAVSHGRFVDKARAIRPAYPQDTRLAFILGFDTLVRLFDPRYYRDMSGDLAALFAAAQVVAANRAPAPPEAVAAFLDQPHVRPFRDRIHPLFLPADIAAVSATAVRRRLARGESVAGLVPPEILPLLTR